MARKKKQSIEQVSIPEQEPVMASNLVDAADDSDGGFVFEYDMSVEDAVPPPALPEGRSYIGVTSGAKHAANKTTGLDQIIVTLTVPPEEYPADFPADLYPEGVEVPFFSARLDNSAIGRFNMKNLAKAFAVPASRNVKVGDFNGKRVKFEVQHRPSDDGSTRLFVKGMPVAV